jgi:hypothetical protein
LVAEGAARADAVYLAGLSIGRLMAPTVALVLLNGTADPLFLYAGGMGMANGRAGKPMLGAEATEAFFAAKWLRGAVPAGRGSGDHGPWQRRHGHRLPWPAAQGAMVPIAIAGGDHEWPPGAVTTFVQVIRSTAWATLGELAWAVFRTGLDP